tara:strand:+ start:528 stop:800 length:273 start_codon:yes stop_codon:yes gene_type:complete
VKLNRGFIKNWGIEKALDEVDSEKLCKLKEIAEFNKNHKRALAFNPDELRSSTRHQVRTVLYMVMMSAIQSNPVFKGQYQKLVATAKPRK